MASQTTAPTPLDDLAGTLHDLRAASAYNRELLRLARALRALARRLDAFTEMDPVLELARGLRGLGVGSATAAMEATTILDGFDRPAVPREAAYALIWSMNVAADLLEGVSVAE